MILCKADFVPPICVLVRQTENLQKRTKRYLNNHEMLPVNQPIPRHPDGSPAHGDKRTDHELTNEEVCQQSERQVSCQFDAPDIPAPGLSHLLHDLESDQTDDFPPTAHG